jgi:hypothetical protein
VLVPGVADGGASRSANPGELQSGCRSGVEVKSAQIGSAVSSWTFPLKANGRGEAAVLWDIDFQTVSCVFYDQTVPARSQWALLILFESLCRR